MSSIDLVQLSKTMAYALRHQPEKFGLYLDDEGWVPVQELLTALRQQRHAWQKLSADDFAAVIATSDKKRYELRDGMIRAYYGHSVPQKMQRELAEPPETLFHGTTPEAAHIIQAQGLKSMRRQYVHLSEDLATARQVALRRTNRPAILKIRTREAHRQGIRFYLGNEKVWLADSIPATFIVFPEA